NDLLTDERSWLKFRRHDAEVVIKVTDRFRIADSFAEKPWPLSKAFLFPRSRRRSKGSLNDHFYRRSLCGCPLSHFSNIKEKD
ncbi:hypothetical protein PDJAM_G00179070, partial [Pangasius djambal]|nr:hypothetical protein [Pangasius djambal]